MRWLENLLEAILRRLRTRKCSKNKRTARVKDGALMVRRELARPVEISPGTDFGATIARCVAAGDQVADVFVDALAELGDLDKSAPVVLQFIDFSGSTTGRVAAALVPALHQGRGAILDECGDGYMGLFGFNSEVFTLEPQRPIQTIRWARLIGTQDFQPREAGGFAASGTNISQAIVVGVSIGLGFHHRGHRGPIVVPIWTDGWDTSDNEARRRCREALKLARRNNIVIEIHGFCPRKHWGKYQAWTSAVGLRHDSEAFVEILDSGADIVQAVAKSVIRHTEAITEHLLLEDDSDTPTPRVLA